VRVGVVGTSEHTDRVHLANLQSHPRAEIVAICGRNQERAGARALKYEIPRVFAHYEDMIEHAGLDAVVVAAPDDLHFPIAMAALDAGLHVLCEKPLAGSYAEAQTLAKQAAAKNVKHMTYFSWRWPPAQRYVGDLLEQGFLGRCYHVELRFLHGFSRSHDYEWRLDANRACGVLGDLGSHLIDLARHYVGEVSRVSADLATHIERQGPNGAPLNPANDSAMLLLHFANGAQGSLQCSAVAHVAEHEIVQQVQLQGELGTLAMHYSSRETSVVGARHDEARLRPLPIPNSYWGDARRDRPLDVFRSEPVGDRLFIEAIVEDRPIVPSFQDGAMVQAIIEAALESDRLGHWVEVTCDN
ncbi:MAG TPA: Gfo/Idh/MocA family oxidoreductase, partial [Chloroflexota bacterium]|nr:Gfo/Idh/MocA family oxidoreductase [Chloroflexota bacterium]